MPVEMWESESDSLVVRPVAPTCPSFDSDVMYSCSSEDVTQVSDADMPSSCLATMTGSGSVMKWSRGAAQVASLAHDGPDPVPGVFGISECVEHGSDVGRVAKLVLREVFGVGDLAKC